MKISLLLTGSELMIGSTVDSNSAYVAQKLQDFNLIPFKKVTVGDDLELLIQILNELALTSDIIIMNGGLGPTEDDLTAEAIAKAFDQKIVQNKHALAHLEERFSKGTTRRNASNLKQANLPEAAEIIPNPIGSAVGFSIRIKDCTIICTPGVPSEMKLMFEEHILNFIQGKLSQPHHKMKLIRTFGCGESSLQELINQSKLNQSKNIIVGFRAHFPYVDVKLTASDKNHFDELDQIYQKMDQLFLQFKIAQEEKSFPEIIQALMNERNETLSCAESCTGGLIASLLTQIPGASHFFQSSLVVYSNEMKTELLNVSPATLEKYGAVSEQTVYEMAQNLLDKTKSDYAITISGIAGPDGGTAEKPVGTLWIGFGNKKQIHTRSYLLHGRRLNIQKHGAYMALDLLRRFILNLDLDINFHNFKTLKK